MTSICGRCCWKPLASRPGLVTSRKALMDSVYDDSTNVDERNIDSHIKRLRMKFTASDSEFDMVESLYGVGYCFKEAPAACSS